MEINKKLSIGISDNYTLQPTNDGLRHADEKGTAGWFIWFGEYFEDDFFLNQYMPNIH